MRLPPGGAVGFAPAEQTHLADAGLICLSPGGRGRCGACLAPDPGVFPGLPGPKPWFLRGLPGPAPRGTFPSPEKYPKGRSEGGGFRFPPPSENTHPLKRRKGGRPPPFGYPRIGFHLSSCPSETSGGAEYIQ